MQSLGSNKALELLNSRSIDFGSTAGAAALIGKANGNPIKSVYVYSKPEWTALVTGAKSNIQKVEDLKGKRVAVTRGTDPHIFLLRALDRANLSQKDVELIQLQHPDGRAALEKGDVDAWAGLDPHMARTEVEKGSRLFFREPNFNSYGVLNVRSAFAKDYPSYSSIKNYSRRHKKRSLNLNWTKGLILPVVLLIGWEILARIGFFPPNLLPAPTSVIVTIWELAISGELFNHIAITLYRVALGFVIGGGVATVLGALTGYSPLLYQLLDPLLQSLRSIPSLAWVPLFILWMGIYETSKVALIAVGVFFPVYLNLMSGVQGVDGKLVEVGKFIVSIHYN